MTRRLVLLLALATSLAVAAPRPYDVSADADAALRQALGSAKAAQRSVLGIFGANWCEDCRSLDKSLGQGRNAALVAREFEVVKVDRRPLQPQPRHRARLWRSH